MARVAGVFPDGGCHEEVLEQPKSEWLRSYHFRHLPSFHFRTSTVFALLLLSNLCVLAYSIPEIVAKTKQAVVEIVTIDKNGLSNRLGTGFFISQDGQVVTNQHVVAGAASIAAVNGNGVIFLFERTIAQPAGVDLAILKFRATAVPFLPLGNSATAVEGQTVIVVGNPSGLTATISNGIISAFREKRSLIQITAPISRESSGSPVMDENGQVIGVATLQSVEGRNLNFAIAVEEVFAALPLDESSGPSLLIAIANDYYDSGLSSLGKRDYDKAISDFTEAIRLDPNYVLAYNDRGVAYNNQGSFDKAISDYSEVIRLDPSYIPAYIDRGIAYGNQGSFDKAVSDFTEAIRLDPNCADAYTGRGIAYTRQSDLDKANADFAAADRLKAAQ
jgi:S1-C subfamily serine protease